MAVLYDNQIEIMLKQVMQAQQGDGCCRDTLLETYRPFIFKTASRYCRRYLREGRDEEVSVAYLGFNEAINKFRPEQGGAFLNFARLVMERRLADYYRRSACRSREIPFSDIEEGPNGEAGLRQVDSKAAEIIHSEQEAGRDRQQDVIRFSALLSTFGITLGELVRISPKHADARARAVMAARAVAGNVEWKSYFLARKELPLKAMEEVLPLSRKTLERQRKYIVALVLVFSEDLPYLREYLRGVDGE